ncbi:MAG: hypothetical protein ACIAQU_09765 [Phycisphaerales bacterium JB064]
MTPPPEAWLLVVAIGGIGILAMLMTMAAAIRHGVAIATLENRVTTLRAHHRRQLIERGLIADDDELDASSDVDIIEAVPVDEPATPQSQAA